MKTLSSIDFDDILEKMYEKCPKYSISTMDYLCRDWIIDDSVQEIHLPIFAVPYKTYIDTDLRHIEGLEEYYVAGEVMDIFDEVISDMGIKSSDEIWIIFKNKI